LWDANDNDYAKIDKRTQTLDKNCREARKQVQLLLTGINEIIIS